MQKFKQFMNTMADKAATSDPSSGAVVQTFDEDRDGQLSAEGFLCPDCMTAFQSPEILAEHYTTKHSTPQSGTDPDENDAFNLALQQEELLELRATLEIERKQSMEMQRELFTLRNENASRKASFASSRSQSVLPEHDDSETIKLREDCLNLRKQNDDWKFKYDLINKELDNLKSTTTDEIKTLMDSLATFKEDVLLFKNKAEISETECKDLRQEAQRLRDQHSELVNLVEGDEASQAAIDSLTKERDTLILNLDTTQVQNRDLSKNLYNVGIELEKLRSEHQTIGSQFNEYKLKAEADKAIQLKEIAEKGSQLEQEVKAHAETKTTTNQQQKQLSEQAAELSRLKARVIEAEKSAENLEMTTALRVQEINQLTTTVESLTKELHSEKEKCSSSESKIAEFQKVVRSKEDEVKILTMEVSNLQATNRTSQEILQEQTQLFNHYLAEVSSVLGIKPFDESNASDTDLDSHKEKGDAILKKMSDKLLSMNEHQQSLQSQLDRLSKQLLTSNAELEKSVATNEQLSEEMKCQSETNAAEMSNLRKEIIDNQSLFDDKLKAAKKFEEQFSLLNEEMTSLRNDTKRFQDERDNLQAERLDLDKKYKSSEEARALLLDRCLAGESEAEKSNETIQGLQRKLGDALAALQELGRENQSLQVESAKLQGRKWTDDSNVTNCSTCSKEFSIKIRKHHCRVCGNIFCHECSSRTASIPSSKKPVRVCDACSDELSK